MSEVASLTINGKSYELDPDDLTLGEVELLEDTCDCAIQDIDFNRANAMRALVFIFMSRSDPSFSMDDAKAMKVSAFGGIEEPAKAAPKRPTKAAKGG